jgi:hypothetical protein
MWRKVLLVAMAVLAGSAWAASRGVLVEHFGWTS